MPLDLSLQREKPVAESMGQKPLLLIRPELRFEHSYDHPAYDSPCLPCRFPGTKKSQLTFASDAIFFF
jgi:hypothetical protein